MRLYNFRFFFSPENKCETPPTLLATGKSAFWERLGVSWYEQLRAGTPAGAHHCWSQQACTAWSRVLSRSVRPLSWTVVFPPASVKSAPPQSCCGLCLSILNPVPGAFQQQRGGELAPWWAEEAGGLLLGSASSWTKENGVGGMRSLGSSSQPPG